MTEQELDLFMRNVLLDAIALDEETNTETIPYTPSLHHQKQIKAMLKNPLRWARDRKQPVWKRALKRVAVILLVISLAFGSLMVVSPTARATLHLNFTVVSTDIHSLQPTLTGFLSRSVGCIKPCGHGRERLFNYLANRNQFPLHRPTRR